MEDLPALPLELQAYKDSAKVTKAFEIVTGTELVVNATLKHKNRKYKCKLQIASPLASRPATNEHWASKPPASLFTDTPIEQFQVNCCGLPMVTK